MTMYKALTVAGSDTSGGAGLQADIKTMQERDVFGMTAITTIVAQDATKGWYHAVYPVALDVFAAQLDTVLRDIGVQAAKSGMIGSIDIVTHTAKMFQQYNVTNYVMDPVMVCKGVDEAADPELNDALRKFLVPLSLVVTPNLFEAAQLADMPRVTTIEQMKEAAAKIHALGAKYVVVTGGGRLQHEKAVDVLYDGQSFEVLAGDRTETMATHGAGCTFSAAIAAEIAKGTPVREAIGIAKDFITEAIRHSFKLNPFVGPTRHSAYRKFGAGKTE